MGTILQFKKLNAHIAHIFHYHDEMVEKERNKMLVGSSKKTFASQGIIQDAKRYLELHELKKKLFQTEMEDGKLFPDDTAAALRVSIENEMKSLLEIMDVVGLTYSKLPGK
jgi:hypothetical protein